MVVTIKLDVNGAFLWIAYVVVAVGALWLAFPGLHKWFPSTSSELASWVQAIGGLIAIFFAGRFVAKQIMHADMQQRRVQRDADLSTLWACMYAAGDAFKALDDLSDKLAGVTPRPPSSSTERIESLEETIRVLIASKPPPAAASSLLTVMAELAYSRVAIRECNLDGDRTYQIKTSKVRARKVRDARDTLAKLYKLMDHPK
ncbi:MAG: hypothetical protein RR574_18820 [Comamonas sp.]